MIVVSKLKYRRRPKIFITYRRSDTDGHAGRLHADLTKTFPQHNVFFDIGTLKAGDEFSERIEQTIHGCDVLIAVIGRNWLSAKENNRRRIDNRRDLVRREVAMALQRKIVVIPVLVQDASMPTEDDLPNELKPLSHRSATMLSDHRWNYDVKQLINQLKDIAPLDHPGKTFPWSKMTFTIIGLFVFVFGVLAATWLLSSQRSVTSIDAAANSSTTPPQHINQSTPSYQTVVALVSEFDGPDQDQLGVSRIIAEQMNEAVRDYQDIKIQRIPDIVQNRSDAAEKCNQYGGSLILWGSYSKSQTSVRMNVNFELLRPPNKLRVHRYHETFIKSINELNRFSIQETLSEKMTHLVFLAAGLMRLSARDYDGAIRFFTQAIITSQHLAGNAGFENVYLYRGIAHAEKTEYEEAIADFNKALKLRRRYCLAHLLIADALSELGKVSESVGKYQVAIDCDPTIAGAHNNLAIAYQTLGRHELAIDSFSKAITIDGPGKADSLSNRAGSLTILRRFNEAQEDLQNALTIDPNARLAIHNLGTLELQRGNYPEATRLFERLIEMITNEDLEDAVFLAEIRAAAYNGRGLTHQFAERYDDALRDFSEAIRLKPSYTEPYVNRGLLLIKRRKYEAAVADLDIAIRLNPLFDAAFCNRGVAYREMGDYSRAKADFDEAIRIDPNQAETHDNLGLLFTLQKKYDEAMVQFNIAIDLNPNVHYTYKERGDVWFYKGEYESAIKDYEKALLLKPDNAAASASIEQARRKLASRLRRTP